jgi:hypothetical protein
MGILLTVGTVTAVQLNDWVSWNGYVWKGMGVNHFGEKFATTLDQWLFRAFLSPFAWPAIVLTLGFWLLVIFALSRISRKFSRFLFRRTKT